MHYFEMADVYQFNNARRERLLEKAFQFDTKLEQMKFVVDYFLNNLPVSEILEIDAVNPSYLTFFKYDYAFLDDVIPRRQSPDYYNMEDSSITLHSVDCDTRNGQRAKIYPTIFALKKGTCQMFANEIKRFAMDFNIDCEIVKELTNCYDCFYGYNTNNEQITANDICKMLHYYNIVTIDNVKYKIDIAGFLMALDYMKNNPEVNLQTDTFYFSTDLKTNPFNALSPTQNKEKQ